MYLLRRHHAYPAQRVRKGLFRNLGHQLVFLGHDLLVIGEFGVKQPDPQFGVALPREKELLRRGQLQGTWPAFRKLLDLHQPFPGRQDPLFPEQAPQFRDFPVGDRQPVPVGRNHPEEDLLFRGLLLQQDAGQVVSRLVRRSEGTDPVDQFPENLRIHRYRPGLRLLRHLRELLAGESGQPEVPLPRRDLHVVPFLAGHHHWTLRQDLRDVEYFSRRKRDRSGFPRLHRLDAPDDDLKIGGHERRIGLPDGQQYVGQHRHGVPPFRHALNPRQQADELVTIHSEVHDGPLLIKRM